VAQVVHWVEGGFLPHYKAVLKILNYDVNCQTGNNTTNYRSNEGEIVNAKTHPSSILHPVADPDHYCPHLHLRMVRERVGESVSEGLWVERAVVDFCTVE
jgi:hypothetical protein